jgi:hypothetical protein
MQALRCIAVMSLLHSVSFQQCRHCTTAYQQNSPSNLLPFGQVRTKDFTIGLRPSPLLGGPSWLPLHVKVVAQSSTTQYTWDFLPINATDPSTLQRLTSLQSVPGVLRRRRKILASTQNCALPVANETDSTIIAARGDQFCDAYQNTELNLVTNNCWTFALQLLFNLTMEALIQ